MSANVQIKTEIKNWDLLKEALTELKYDFQEGEDLEVRGYSGNNNQKANLVITSNSKPIGFKKASGDNGMITILGDGDYITSKFKQAVYQKYSELNVTSLCRSRGYNQINTTQRNDGVVVITARVA